MKLRDLFQHFERMHRGQATTAETRQAIFGDVDSADARRLGLYNHVKSVRARELGASFPICAQTLGARWSEVCLAYFIEHPWGRFDFHPAGDAFAAFLARPNGARDGLARPNGARDGLAREVASGIPPWLPELARLEWSKTVAARSAAATEVETGPLRLAPTVELHELAYDCARWMIQTERSAEPVPWVGAAVTWRGLKGTGRVGPLDPMQLAMLEQIRNGTLDLVSLPGERDKISRSLESFLTAGVVLGDPSTISEALQPALPHTLVLVPFAHVSWQAGSPVISAPGAREAVSAEDPVLLAVASRLARPCTLAELAVDTEIDEETACYIAEAMWSAGLVMAPSIPESAPSPPARLAELLERACIVAPLRIDVHGNTLVLRAELDGHAWFEVAREAGALQQRLLDVARVLGITLLPVPLTNGGDLAAFVAQ